MLPSATPNPKMAVTAKKKPVNLALPQLRSRLPPTKKNDRADQIRVRTSTAARGYVNIVHGCARALLGKRIISADMRPDAAELK